MPASARRAARTPFWAARPAWNDFAIEPNGTTTQTQSCVVESDLSLFSLLPHMHTMGRHLTFTLTRQDGEEIVLHDEAYDFDAQVNRPFDPPVEIAAGDTIPPITITFTDTASSLSGSLVTADALNTQTETARIIVQEKGGDFLFTVKGNQPGVSGPAEFRPGS